MLKEDILKAWEQGNKNKKQIIEEFDCSPQYVNQVLSDELKTEKRALMWKLLRLKQAGLHPEEIAKELDVNIVTVYRRLKRAKEDLAPELWPFQLTTDTPDFEEIVGKVKAIADKFLPFGWEFDGLDKKALFVLEYAKCMSPISHITKVLDVTEQFCHGIVTSLLALHHDNERLAMHISYNFVTKTWGEPMVRLFTNWKQYLPERKPLFEWLMSNMPKYHHSKSFQSVIRKEQLFWFMKQNSIPTHRPKEARLDRLTDEQQKVLKNANDLLDDIYEDLRIRRCSKKYKAQVLKKVNIMTVSINNIHNWIEKDDLR